MTDEAGQVPGAVATAPAPWVRALLRCPRCGGDLLDGDGPDGAPELWCAEAAARPCGLRYRVSDGVPVLLVDEARDPAGVLTGAAGADPTVTGDMVGRPVEEDR